ncbi:MAG: quaternary ammonium compound efflux SMR transporter SugE [Candidatus Paracaedibacteraceae bacterium]|nr:quaternary ammonium compound efflux SMR transporter SugE [Candidatus Paracaedibacteraceae bacterium]
MTLAWTYLIIAGLLEIVWAIGLKYTQGFTQLWPSVITITSMVASVFLLAKAVETLPIGTAYAIWVGIGACGTALFGLMVLQETASPLRLFFLALLIVSITGLKLSSSS